MPQNTKAKPKPAQPALAAAPRPEYLPPAEEELARALANIAKRVGARFVRRTT